MAPPRSDAVTSQALSAIGRRKAELMKNVASLAFGHLAVYSGLQAAARNPRLLAASLSLIPFCIVMLLVLRFNQMATEPPPEMAWSAHLQRCC